MERNNLNPLEFFMASHKSLRKHERIQQAILSSCNSLGIKAIPEYKGSDWRADVLIPNEQRPIAFEIQLSHQSLRKTLDRQTKYNRDGIVGCWLFEKPVPKLKDERASLPLFYVEEDLNFNLQVDLLGRRKVDLAEFLHNFISNKIQFKTSAKTKTTQLVKLVFYEFECWKCHEMNHLYYVDTPFYSACNAKIESEEALWGSNAMEYRPEIVQAARSYISSRSDISLNLGTIKERFSNTVGKSYISFGCSKCDSIFGDFYVMERKIDVVYEPQEIVCEEVIKLKEVIEIPIEHWCFPQDGGFCDEFDGLTR